MYSNQVLVDRLTQDVRFLVSHSTSRIICRLLFSSIADGRIILQGECSFCDSILVIQNATTEDSGNYSCNARDGPGQQYFLVTVNSNSTSISAIGEKQRFI